MHCIRLDGVDCKIDKTWSAPGSCICIHSDVNSKYKGRLHFKLCKSGYLDKNVMHLWDAESRKKNGFVLDHLHGKEYKSEVERSRQSTYSTFYVQGSYNNDIQAYWYYDLNGTGIRWFFDLLDRYPLLGKEFLWNELSNTIKFFASLVKWQSIDVTVFHASHPFFYIIFHKKCILLSRQKCDYIMQWSHLQFHSMFVMR